MTTTRSDSDQYIGKDSKILETSKDEFSEDPVEIVSLPPVENDSVGEISLKKQMNSSPSTSVSVKDPEIVHSASIEVSCSETSSLFFKETEAIDVEDICPEAVTVPQTEPAFLEEDRVVGELQQFKETYAANVSLSEPCSVISREGEDLGEDLHKIEGVDDSDDAVISTSEIQVLEEENIAPNGKERLNSEKKIQDSDIQRLLEAEKKRLLAEIEIGTIFGKQADVDTLASASDSHEVEKIGNGSKEQHKTMERVGVKNNAFLGKSMKVELIDDTALVDVVSFYKKVNDHSKRPGNTHTDKDAPRKHKKIGEKPIDVKPAKPTGKKDKGNAVEGNASTKLSELHNHEEKDGKRLRIMYSRKQMESMKFAQIENQKKLWSDMYARLLPEVVTEYESLVSSKNHKTSKSNLAQGQSALRESGIGILGENLGAEEDYAVEDEYTGDNDDYKSILRPAFEVDGEPDFDSGPPEDGLEYLRRVRWEAKQFPNVKVAKIDGTKYKKKEQSVYMPQIPEIPKCPDHHLPVKEWEDSLLSDFLNLRTALSQNENNYEDEITSSQSVDDVFMNVYNKRLETDTDESIGVMLSEIQGMDSVTRVSKLKKHISLIEKEEKGLQSNECKWVIALCAGVETPLDADTSASLRGLLRKCASLRAEVEDEKVIIMANMLITISGKYFGQMEL